MNDNVTFLGGVENEGNNPEDWTPSEMLSTLLRRINSGELDVTQLVVMYKFDKGDATGTEFNTNYAYSGDNAVEAVGLIELCKHQLLVEGNE